MKVLIYFNAPDKPENMGICQLVNDLTAFLEEHEALLPNPVVYSDNFRFDISGREDKGYAAIVEVPNDFQN